MATGVKVTILKVDEDDVERLADRLRRRRDLAIRRSDELSRITLTTVIDRLEREMAR